MERRKHHGRFAGFDLARRSGKTSALSDGLEGWLSAHGMKPQHYMLTQLWKNWEVVMGPDIAALAHPLGHRNGILLVGGDDSCAMQELSYAAPEILERVNAFMNEDYFHKWSCICSWARNPCARVDIRSRRSSPRRPGRRVSGI